MSFEMSTDTIGILRRGERASGVTGHGARDILYGVQIEAFRELSNASSAEERAREKFAHPVFRYQDTSAGLYHIRVGRFSARKAAENLKSGFLTTFPHDYKDCWVVQLSEPE